MWRRGCRRGTRRQSRLTVCCDATGAASSLYSRGPAGADAGDIVVVARARRGRVEGCGQRGRAGRRWTRGERACSSAACAISPRPGVAVSRVDESRSRGGQDWSTGALAALYRARHVCNGRRRLARRRPEEAKAAVSCGCAAGRLNAHVESTKSTTVCLRLPRLGLSSSRLSSQPNAHAAATCQSCHGDMGPGRSANPPTDAFAVGCRQSQTPWPPSRHSINPIPTPSTRCRANHG